MQRFRRSEASVHLLALDGGGIRGVSELVILHAMMQRIQQIMCLDVLPKPCEFFNLIAGTSTGGLVAIMLGRLEMSTAEAIAEYDTFAEKIFTTWNRKVDITSQYKASTLQDVFEDLVARRNMGDKMLVPGYRDKGNAFVCAKPTNAGNGIYRRFRTYDMDKWGKTCKIWEAARATTAAPGYFKPMEITSGDITESYIDAAVGCNNPVKELRSEAIDVFGKDRQLGCIVSLGTGSKQWHDFVRDKKPGGTFRWVGRAGKLLKETVIDTDSDVYDVEAQLKDFSGDYFFRFSVPGGAENISLSRYKKIDELKKKTEAFIGEVKDEIDAVVDILLGRRKRDHVLTLGNVCFVDDEDIFEDDRRAARHGKSTAFFVGRQEPLKRLEQCFYQRDRTDETLPRREFLLHGMGGVGKTQIALKFSEEYKQRFSHVFWVDATTVGTIKESYLEIGDRIFPTGSRRTLEDVLEWFANSKDEWLLILDNWVPSHHAFYVPEGDLLRGNIIYTTRSKDGMNLQDEYVLELAPMEKEDAITLLLTASERLESSEEKIVAEHVVRELGYLPLAIDHAGAYISFLRLSFDIYLKRFCHYRRNILNDEKFSRHSDYDKSVYAAFDISYQTLVQFSKKERGTRKSIAGRSAIRILNAICFYHNEGVMDDIFNRAAVSRYKLKRRRYFPMPSTEDLTPEPLLDVDEDGHWESRYFDLGLRLLERLSIIKRDQSRMSSSMHVLQRSFLQDRMDEFTLARQAFTARALLADSLTKSIEPDNMIYNHNVVQHALESERFTSATRNLWNALQEHMPYNSDIFEADWCQQLARLYTGSGHFAQAESSLERAYSLMKWEYGFDGHHTLKVLEALADVYDEQGRYNDAHTLLYWVKEYRRTDSDFGPEHPMTRRIETKLAGVVARQGHYQEAVALRKETVKKRVETGDKLKTNIMNCGLLKLGWLASQPDEETSNRLIELATEIFECTQTNYGRAHPETISAQIQLACFYYAVGRYEEAKPMVWDAWGFRSNLFGMFKTKTLQTMMLYSKILRSLGDHEESESLAQLAYSKSEESLGDRHPATLQFLHDWGDALACLGRWDLSVKVLKLCWIRRKTVLGPEHPETIQVCEDRELIERCRQSPDVAAQFLRFAGSSRQGEQQDTKAQMLIMSPPEVRQDRGSGV